MIAHDERQTGGRQMQRHDAGRANRAWLPRSVVSALALSVLIVVVEPTWFTRWDSVWPWVILLAISVVGGVLGYVSKELLVKVVLFVLRW